MKNFKAPLENSAPCMPLNPPVVNHPTVFCAIPKAFWEFTTASKKLWWVQLRWIPNFFEKGLKGYRRKSRTLLSSGRKYTEKGAITKNARLNCAASACAVPQASTRPPKVGGRPRRRAVLQLRRPL